MCKSTWVKEIDQTNELTYMCLEHSELLYCTALRGALVVCVNRIRGQCTTCKTACGGPGNILSLALPLSSTCYCLNTISEKLSWPFNHKELHPSTPLCFLHCTYHSLKGIWFSLCFSILNWKFLEGRGVICLIHRRCLICICGMSEWDTQYMHLKQCLKEGRLLQKSLTLSPTCLTEIFSMVILSGIFCFV